MPASETRKIIHIDMDAFFASVEQRDNPRYRGRPIAVGGSSLRGVVAAASYEARKFGVRSAMPSVQATRLCPQIIFVKSRFDVYRAVSQDIREIFFEYTDAVEPLSLDEAYLDVTFNKKGIGSAIRVAQLIKETIINKTQLTASAGISYNKFLAKIASGYNKPDGMKVILPKDALSFLEQLPIEKFHGIGRVTAKKMHALGIKRGADLKDFSQNDLIYHFGKVGLHFYQIVRGIDERPVKPNRLRKSIGIESTFPHDLLHLNAMTEELLILSQELEERVSRHNAQGRTLTLKVKFANFTLITRSFTSPSYLTNSSQWWPVALKLLQDAAPSSEGVRLLGLSLSNLRANQQFATLNQLNFGFYESQSN